jgi:prepilin-type N-terminal cleavage/methylation domain-containing protein
MNSDSLRRGFSLVESPAVSTREREAFTLVELLVVIAIIGILVALLLPAIQAAREAARRTQCVNNLKQLGLAAHNYIATKNGFLPGGLFQEVKTPGGQQGETFFVHLLPYMEEQAVYDKWDFTSRRNNSCTPGSSSPCSPDSPAGSLIQSLLCPSDNPAEKVCFFQNPVNSGGYNMAFPGYYGVTSYAGNHGTKSYFALDTSSGPAATDDGMFTTYGPSGVCYPPGGATNCKKYDQGIGLKTVTDGTSKTVLFGERYNEDPIFDAMNPTDRSGLLIHQWALWGWTGSLKGTGHATRSGWLEINRKTPESCRGGGGFTCQDERLTTWGSGHPGGANFIMSDGSAQFFEENMSVITLQAISTRNKAENTPN